MKLKSVVIVLLLATGSISHAQEGPSYRETVEFIQSKFNPNHRPTSPAASVYKSGYFFEEKDRCRFNLMRNFYHKGFQGITEIQTRILNLEAFDPSRIERNDFEDGRISFNFYTQKEERNVKRFELGRRDFVSSNGYQNIFPDQNCQGQENNFSFCRRAYGRSFSIFSTHLVEPANINAERLSRAFAHLIRLCGGREELF